MTPLTSTPLGRASLFVVTAVQIGCLLILSGDTVTLTMSNETGGILAHPPLALSLTWVLALGAGRQCLAHTETDDTPPSDTQEVTSP